MNQSIDTGLFFLRLTAAGTMLGAHGIPKLMKFDQLSHSFPDPLGIGSLWSLVLVLLAEVLMSILIIIGIYVRLASLPLIIAMAVAVFVIHGSDPWSQKELAFVFMGMFTCLFFTGGGSYTLDQWFKKK